MMLDALVKLRKYRAIGAQITAAENDDNSTRERLEDLRSDCYAAEANFWESIEDDGLFDFIQLVAKVRVAQVEYFIARQKGAAKSQCEKLLAKSKQLEAQLDKELKLFANPPMF